MTSFDDLFVSKIPERIATGFVFTEGPLWDPKGFLYVSDVDASVHYRVFPGRPESDRVEVIRTESGGANGATFDANGRLVICEQDARQVVRYEGDGAISVIASRHAGLRLNRCNDIVRKSDGALYFTDPDKKGLPESDKELGHAAIWRLGINGLLELMAKDMNHPNGLAFSPDESRLYVSNSRPDPHLHVYNVAADGRLERGRLVDEMPYGPRGELDGVPDGLKIDANGRIFSTGPGGIWIWDTDESFIGRFELPELPANLGWGGADNTDMYVTARTSVYRLGMGIKAKNVVLHLGTRCRYQAK